MPGNFIAQTLDKLQACHCLFFFYCNIWIFGLLIYWIFGRSDLQNLATGKCYPPILQI